ncbi:MAG: hypothetical protein FJX75_20355 [Armatimonadetes bacterium]|nr:hypothetical protein [Armatimonadota bacterium]
MSIQRRRDKAIGSTTNEEGRRERVRRVADEVPAWRELQALGGRRSRLHFIECAPWPHVEATYYTKGTPEERDQHRTRRLVKARRSLLRCARKQITDPEALALFEGLLKAEDEL